MIVFKNVSKGFGSLIALENVSFEIDEGEFAFITGPSGAGKTTILRLLLQEITPTKGEIFVKGKSVTKLKSKELPIYRRQIGVVFQDYKLLFDRTVGENVSLALAVAGFPLEKQLARSREVLAFVGLADRFDSFPAQLAGGELQRVVIARALANSPHLLLADEPTGNLDPDTAWEIIELMQKINKNGTTIVMATHNRDVVDETRRRVIELKKGKVVRDQKNGKYKE